MRVLEGRGQSVQQLWPTGQRILRFQNPSSHRANARDVLRRRENPSFVTGLAGFAVLVSPLLKLFGERFASGVPDDRQQLTREPSIATPGRAQREMSAEHTRSEAGDEET